MTKAKEKAMGNSKENEMQTQTQTPPLPKAQKARRAIVNAEVDPELFAAVKAGKPEGVFLCDIVEWGLRAYLLKTNPKAAAKLGIKAE